MKVFCCLLICVFSLLMVIGILIGAQWLFWNGPLWICRMNGEDSNASFALVIGTLGSLALTVAGCITICFTLSVSK